MENPTRFEENLETLSTVMHALDELSSTVSRTRQQQMKDWLQRVDAERRQVDDIWKELNDAKKGSQLINFSTRYRLNPKVIKSIIALNKLTEEGNASSKFVKAYLHELIEDKPREFSHDDLRSFTSNFSPVNKIGSDWFGDVYKGKFSNGRHVSIKVLEEKDVAEEIFMSEVTTMEKTKQQYVVKLYGFCFSESMKAIVYEYFENKPLDNFLYERGSVLPWNRLYRICIEVAKGLSYLHEGCRERIIHHDVRASNVLLDSRFSPKIKDFGLSKISNWDVSHVTLTRTRGSPGYAAPEMYIPKSPITEKCDVYSFGMMLFELLGRSRISGQGRNWFPKKVWEKFNSQELDQLFKEHSIAENDRENAKVLVTVALWCVQHSPEARPSMRSVVEMLEKGVHMHIDRPPNPFIPAMQF